MEHIEEAGIHSGDSACSLPVYTLSDEIVDELERQTKAMAKALKVGGLMNVQYAIKDGTIYVLEVNPRASRTVPFVAKTIGAPIAKIAARIMAGEKLDDAIAAYGKKPDPRNLNHIAVKEAVFPFARFPGVDILLGPEMRSTGEVIGLDTDFALAFAKAQLGAGVDLPREGTVFVSVRDEDKERVLPAIRILTEIGFKVMATGGTARFLGENGITAIKINKVQEGRPHIEDAIRNRQVHLVIKYDGQQQGDLGLKIAAPRDADAESAVLYDDGRRGSGSPRDQGAQGRQFGSAHAAELFLRRNAKAPTLFRTCFDSDAGAWA